MTYTEEEIEKYLKILKSYKNNQSENKENKVRCSNCQNDSFTIELGQNVCEECGLINGHVLGYFDLKEQDRFHFKKGVFIIESITIRKRLIKYLKD